MLWRTGVFSDGHALDEYYKFRTLKEIVITCFCFLSALSKYEDKRGKGFFFPPEPPHRLWGPPNLKSAR
jgi:hypothetical protein